MINTLLEHVPIKLEPKVVDSVDGVEDEGEEAIDDDEALDSESSFEDEAAELPISSDEEAELEAQRIRIHELIGKNLLQSRVRRLRSGSSSGSSVVVLEQQSKQRQQPTPTPQQQKQQEIEVASDKSKRSRSRASSTASCSASSVASSFVTPASQTESCGNIFVYPEQQKLIFNCSFCDLRYGDMSIFSKHLHEAHKLFQETVVEETCLLSPLQRKRGRKPTVHIKKEPTPPPMHTADELEIFPTSAPLESCGNIFVLNRKKLFLICGYCECKYANLELFQKHLCQQHQLFAGPTREIDVRPKPEVKTEVFIITELVASPQSAHADAVTAQDNILAAEQPMVAIPEGMQLNNNALLPLSPLPQTPSQTPETPPPEVEEERKEEEKEEQQLVQHDKTVTVSVEVEIQQEAEVEMQEVETQKVRIQEVDMQEVIEDAQAVPAAVEAIQPKAKKVTPKKRKRKSKLVFTKKKNRKIKTNISAPSTEPSTEPSLENTTEPVLSEHKPEVLTTTQELNATENLTPPNHTAASKRMRRTSSIRKSYKEFFDDTPKESTTAPTPPPQLDQITKQQQEPPSSPESVAAIYSAVVDEMRDTVPTENADTASKTVIAPVELLQLRFPCDQCSKSFQKISRLNEHKRLHTGEKPFSCDECGKSFRIKMRLTEHKMRHRTEKAFKCTTCGLAVATKQDLTLHQRHHNGDRRYQCNDCPKAFVRSSDLKTHLRVHTGEKPYVCEICNKCFRANQNLIVHRRSHSGVKDYKCEICEKCFMRKIDRKVHMRTHTGEKPFRCEICQRGYSSRVHVRTHIEREHVANKLGIVRERKKPGPKPKRLNEELAKQKQLIEELQQQLLRQIKTDEKIIPAENEEVEQQHERLEEKEEIKLHEAEQEEQRVTTQAPPRAHAPASKKKNNPHVTRATHKTPLKQQQHSSPTPPQTLTIMQKIEQHSPPQMVGMQQVSVTVSMQVENVVAATTTVVEEPQPEKENDNVRRLKDNVTHVKKEKKITSYFTVVGQKTEI